MLSSKNSGMIEFFLQVTRTDCIKKITGLLKYLPVLPVEPADFKNSEIYSMKIIVSFHLFSCNQITPIINVWGHFEIQ